MKRGTRVVVTLPNGDEAAARFVSETGGEVMVQLFGEHHATTTDKGYRILPIADVQIDDLESKGMKHSSGRSVKAHAAREFGMPVSSTHAEVIAKIKQVLEDSIPHADDRVNQANGNCPWEQPS